MQIQDDKPYDDINITPMLDLAYVLLVIFILMTTATVQGTKANLPKASKSSGPPPKVKAKAILLDNSGNIRMDAEPVTLQVLEQRLQAAKAQHPETPVVIRGDDLTKYQGVMDVVDVVNRVGLQVSLATKPPGK